MNEERYRYYTCELKWNMNMWECTRTEGPRELHILSKDALVSQLIPIDKSSPKFVDPLILGYKLKKPVIVKNQYCLLYTSESVRNLRTFQNGTFPPVFTYICTCSHFDNGCVSLCQSFSSCSYCSSCPRSSYLRP